MNVIDHWDSFDRDNSCNYFDETCPNCWTSFDSNEWCLNCWYKTLENKISDRVSKLIKGVGNKGWLDEFGPLYGIIYLKDFINLDNWNKEITIKYWQDLYKIYVYEIKELVKTFPNWDWEEYGSINIRSLDFKIQVEKKYWNIYKKEFLNQEDFLRLRNVIMFFLKNKL